MCARAFTFILVVVLFLAGLEVMLGVGLWGVGWYLRSKVLDIKYWLCVHFSVEQLRGDAGFDGLIVAQFTSLHP